MDVRHPLSRRRFFGGVAAAMGALGLRPSGELFAQGQTAQFGGGEAEYDAFAKLASNENNFGPPQNVMQAMNHAWKYANRYGYPDANVIQEIAAHHGVKPENVLLTPGSGEVLEVVGEAFLMGGKKVVGADPTYATVYQHATQHQGRGHQGAAAEELPAGPRHDDQRGQQERRDGGAVLPVQPEQPDRHGDQRRRRQEGGRGHPEDDADPHRRGLPPLRGRPGLRHLDPLRDRRPAGDRRPHLLEDRGAGGDARRLRHLDARDHQAAARLRLEQRQRAGQARRRRVAQGHCRPGRGEEEDRRPAQPDHARTRSARLPGDPLADQLLHGQPATTPPCSRPSRRSGPRASWSGGRSRRC